jgi:Fe-S cluster biogenesis protein NfuA
MDLHAWITQQVDRVERLIEEGEWPPSQTDGVRLRCEADRRILARHRIDSAVVAFPGACEGCGLDDWGLPNIESVNDCPELLDLAHAHGITPDILASLDRPQAPEPKPATSPRLGLGDILAAPPITTSDVPAALRGPSWKP